MIFSSEKDTGYAAGRYIYYMYRLVFRCWSYCIQVLAGSGVTHTCWVSSFRVNKVLPGGLDECSTKVNKVLVEGWLSSTGWHVELRVDSTP